MCRLVPCSRSEQEQRWPRGAPNGMRITSSHQCDLCPPLAIRHALRRVVSFYAQIASSSGEVEVGKDELTAALEAAERSHEKRSFLSKGGWKIISRVPPEIRVRIPTGYEFKRRRHRSHCCSGVDAEQRNGLLRSICRVPGSSPRRRCV